MADGLWNIQKQMLLSSGVFKRQRSDYDLPVSREPSGYEMQNYLARDNYHVGPQVLKDTKTIDSAYDRYLQNQVPSRTSGEPSTYGGVGLGRDPGGGTPGLSLEDQGLMSRPRAVPDLTPIRGSGFGSQLPVDVMPRPGRETLPLPPDASNTIYVEGLPSNCTKREVAHIFRPFVGYKEVRLVSKESKHRGGDPLILCFVDFVNAACAATAMSALQGYKMDEHDPDSVYLRLQFSRHPGPRSSSGSRGKR